MIVRQNLYSLNNAQVAEYVRGVKALKANGVYDQLVNTHAQVMRQVHRTPLFLPWHRAFLLEFESQMQSVLGNPNFAVPYWDWTNDVAGRGGIGIIWNASEMGGSGDPVPNGPFVPAEWPTISPNGQFGNQLIRNLGGTGRPVTTVAQVNAVYKASPYDSFRIALESGPHDNMHTWVGGQMASVPNSVNDPVFFLHHANIDRIWAQWQQYFPNLPTVASGMSPSTLMPPTLGSSGVVSVGSVVDAPFSRYEYDRYYIADATWSGDALIPDANNAYSLSASPALAVFQDKLYCVRQGRGDSGWTWQGTNDGSSWSGDALIPDANNAYGLSDSPALAVFQGKLYCIRQGRGNSGWAWSGTNDGSGWSGDALLPDANNAYGLSGSPALAVFRNKLYCVRQGRGDSGWTWCATFDGASWSGDALIPSANNAFGVSASPALAVYNGKLYCVRQGRGNSGWTWCATFDGSNWSHDELIPDAANAYGLSGSPALAVYGGKLYCVRQGRGDSGWTWCGTFDGTNWSTDALIPSASNAYGLSDSPALAVFNGNLYCVRQGRGGSGWTWCATASV